MARRKLTKEESSKAVNNLLGKTIVKIIRISNLDSDNEEIELCIKIKGIYIPSAFVFMKRDLRPFLVIIASSKQYNKKLKLLANDEDTRRAWDSLMQPLYPEDRELYVSHIYTISRILAENAGYYDYKGNFLCAEEMSFSLQRSATY